MHYVGVMEEGEIDCLNFLLLVHLLLRQLLEVIEEGVRQPRRHKEALLHLMRFDSTPHEVDILQTHK